LQRVNGGRLVKNACLLHAAIDGAYGSASKSYWTPLRGTEKISRRYVEHRRRHPGGLPAPVRRTRQRCSGAGMVDMEMRAWARLMGRPLRTLHSVGPAVARPAPDRPARVESPTAGGAGAVVLATLRSAPLQVGAVDFAVDLALEGARRLVLVNVVEIPLGRGAHGDLGDPPAVAAAIHAHAERARAAGAAVAELRVRSPRPLAALVQTIAALAPGIVVLGADPDRLSRLRGLSPRGYRRAARALEARTTCLLWLPDRDRLARTAARVTGAGGHAGPRTGRRSFMGGRVRHAGGRRRASPQL